ncbi:MFS general substrate transporter [Ramaria rubella]|nr:MFS general substrate transporter [Ramaria rubella]
MSFPSAAVATDPDPTSQVAWPAGRNLASGAASSLSASIERRDLPLLESRREPWKYDSGISHPHNTTIPGVASLTKWNLFTLSIAMAGAQVAWTVELGYGTPFLLSLGLSEQLTSLVWLAGPISGLIAQPIIGAISDSSTSRYRRRFWIAWSTVVLVISCLTLAYAQDVASVLVDFFGGGVGDWDPKRLAEAKNVAIGIAITAFYLLDFALNALQASLRNLLLDVTPSEQLSAGNAWHGRMTHAGNILGFGFGFLNLANWPVLRILGGSQFRKFCVVGIVILVITVWITCWTQDELQRKPNLNEESGIREVMGNIYNAITNLPKPIRKVCFVQIFAFMAWFPFLFYSTTYIGQVMARQDDKDPDVDVATRAGNFAMLMYSLVAVIAGSLLPQLTKRNERLLDTDEKEDEEAELVRIRHIVATWRTDASSKSRSFKLPRMPLTLRDVWSFALVLYGVISICTFFISTVVQATIAVALIGICWAVAVWAPFAMIMEVRHRNLIAVFAATKIAQFLKEIDENVREPRPSNAPGEAHTIRNQAATTDRTATIDVVSENTALLSHPGPSIPELDVSNSEDLTQVQPVAGGTVLGIHNLAIVFPQFIIALVASVIFRVVDDTPAVIGQPETIYLGKNGVAWVLRFGGLSAFLGAIFAQLIPPTKQERMMRRRLELMKVARKMLFNSNVYPD